MLFRSGIDAIHLWAFPIVGGAPIFVGSATHRIDRPDVAAILGGEFLASGFEISGSLAPGTYDLLVTGRNTQTQMFDVWRVVRVIVR